MAIDDELSRVLDEATAHQLPALIAEWAELDHVRRTIAKALRRDLAVLIARPELVIPVLAWRLTWPNGNVPDQMIEVAGVVAAWLARWAPGKRWLRALLPPVVSIECSIVEEYRTSAIGTLAIGEHALGVVGESTIAWDRETGRRLANAKLAVAGVVKPEWIRDALPIANVTLPPKVRAKTVTWIDDRLALLACNLDIEDDYDQPGYLAIDRATGAILWQTQYTLSPCIVRGGDLVGHSYEAMYVLDLATGTTRTTWASPPISDLAIADDGAIVTRVAGVIQVWDERAAASDPFGTGTTENFLRAAFSRDGTYLFNGGYLREASTGAAIAKLAIGGPRGWLEGGPPRNCQHLGTERFVDVDPFHGIRTFRTSDGTPLHEIAMRARIGDVVAHDSRGRLVAIWDRGGLAIWSTDGPELHRIAAPKPAWESILRFSDDDLVVYWAVAAEGPLASIAIATGEIATGVTDPHVAPAHDHADIVDGMLIHDDLAMPCDAVRLVRHADRYAWVDCYYRVADD